MISYNIHQDEDHSHKLCIYDIYRVVYKYWFCFISLLLFIFNFQTELNGFKKEYIISFFIGFYRKRNKGHVKIINVFLSGIIYFFIAPVDTTWYSLEKKRINLLVCKNH